MFRFRFEMDEISAVEPWGEPSQRNLHWFGLTSGRYWMETPVGEPLRFTAEIQETWGAPCLHVDYYVARLFEDLEEVLPAVLEPVPPDIAQVVTDREWAARAARWVEQDCDEAEGKRRWALYERALAWWWDRGFDTGYLRFGPRFSIWRTGDRVHFRWATRNNEDQGVRVFADPEGECMIDAREFEASAHEFCREVLRTMRRRVEQIEAEGWTRTDCMVDVPALIAEQNSREANFERVIRQEHQTDWNRVRVNLGELLHGMRTSAVSG